MRTHMIAIKANIPYKRKKQLLPAGCSGFLFEFQAATAAEAIDSALLLCRSWLIAHELSETTDLTAADITPGDENETGT